MSVSLQQFLDVKVGQLWSHRGTQRRWRVAAVSRRGDKASLVPVPVSEARPFESETVTVDRLKRDYHLVEERAS